ncbi:MAG: 16S rRNA (uracil(1498)-N(3))-methyltransferase [Nitrospiraceae bacterium]
MPAFFVTSEQVVGTTVIIRGELLRHLRASLRVRPGEELSLTEDHTRRLRVQVTSVTSEQLTAIVIETSLRPAELAPTVILGQALLKHDQMDWVIQKATELGVAVIVPLVTSRGVVRPNGTRIRTQRDRWNRIAFEAAQQAERWDSPEVMDPQGWHEWIAALSPAATRLMLHERRRSAALSDIALSDSADHPFVLAIGPEGGWTEEEATAADLNGFRLVSLGERILRAETAALAGLTLLQGRLGQFR